jgi:hypothetical protein
MRKSTLKNVFLFLGVGLITLQSCKDDSYLAALPPVPDQSFTQEFDTFQTAFDQGWRFKNLSDPVGPNGWGPGQRGDVTFSPYSSKGTNNGYLAAEYRATTGASSPISCWAFSPSVVMQNGDKIIFYTRCALYANGANDSTDFANRMQVKINKVDDSYNVGTGPFDVGNYNITLLDINPFYLELHTDPARYDPNAYPHRWTRFEAVVRGLDKPSRGRFAFRYFLEDAGSNGRGSGIGVDSIAYVSISRGR